MPMTNAQRQKAFRDRRNTLAREAGGYRTFIPMRREPKAFAAATLGLLLAALRNGKAVADSKADDDILTLDIATEWWRLPRDVRQALLDANYWTSAATRELWAQIDRAKGTPARFRVTIEVVTDQRRRIAEARRLKR